MSWTEGFFLKAMRETGPTESHALLYRGLALHLWRKASAKGRRKAVYCLSHVGSGLTIVHLHGDLNAVLPVATIFAECSDWDFDGFDGWRNRDPELQTKVRALYQRYALMVANPTGAAVYTEDERRKAARAVVIARLQ